MASGSQVAGAARPTSARRLGDAGGVLIALSACGRLGFAPDDGGGDANVNEDDAASCPTGDLRGTGGTCVPALVLDDSIVGYWPLDEAEAAREFGDLSGYGHHGTCGDACPVAGQPGIRGQAVDFTGTQQGIVVGALTALDGPTPAFTVAAWVKLRAHDTYGYILSNDRDCCGAYAGFSLWASHYGLGPAIEVWDGTTGPAVQPIEALSLGAWHQVVGTYDSGSASVYVDGEPVATGDLVLSMPPSFPTTIGATSYNAQDFALANGVIDEVLLLARALSADEILALYADYVANAPP